MGGDGSGCNNFGATIVVASLRSLINIAQKEEKEDDRQRKTNKNRKEKKIVVGGVLGNRKKKVSIPFQYIEVLLVIQLWFHYRD